MGQLTSLQYHSIDQFTFFCINLKVNSYFSGSVYRSTHTFLHQSVGQHTLFACCSQLTGLPDLSASVSRSTNISVSIYRSTHISLRQSSGQLISLHILCVSLQVNSHLFAAVSRSTCISLYQSQGKLT